MTRYRNKPREQWSPPENPLGYSQINIYKSSIKQLFKTQVASIANRWTWEQIWNVHCVELATSMKKQKAHIARARYEEKADHQFSSYKALGEVDSIEVELHRRCCNASLRQAFSALRNRFVFLFLMKGIL